MKCNPRKPARGIPGILAIGISLGLSCCGSHPARGTDDKGAGTQPSSSTPERMPDFDLRDLAGNEVRSAQFRGKVILLDFWATWCAPCRKEMPGYEELYRRYRDRGVMVIGIAADSDAASVAKFAKKLGITYPLLVNGMDVQRYGIEGLPTTILADRYGFVRKKVVGFEYAKAFEEALLGLL